MSLRRRIPQPNFTVEQLDTDGNRYCGGAGSTPEQAMANFRDNQRARRQLDAQLDAAAIREAGRRYPCAACRYPNSCAATHECVGGMEDESLRRGVIGRKPASEEDASMEASRQWLRSMEANASCLTLEYRQVATMVALHDEIVALRRSLG